MLKSFFLNSFSLTLAAVLLTRPALAHPHVFIDAEVSFVFSAETITAIDVVWRFDEFFSAQIVSDFDKNKNRKLDPDEMAELSKQTQKSLKEFTYFTHLKIGEMQPRVTTVEDFHIDLSKDLVIYQFRVPLPSHLDPRLTAFAVGFYDETYFVDVALDENKSVKVQGNLPSGCQLKFGEREKKPIYSGAIYPKLIQLMCDGKK